MQKIEETRFGNREGLRQEERDQRLFSCFHSLKEERIFTNAIVDRSNRLKYEEVYQLGGHKKPCACGFSGVATQAGRVGQYNEKQKAEKI